MGQERQQSEANPWRNDPNQPDSLHPRTPKSVYARRITAAAVRHRINLMLDERLPSGWTVQGMAATGDDDRQGAQTDLLVISPRGRCFFLLVKAPEDRWWDGDIRRVSAEPLSPQEAAFIARLKQAGHGARAVWNTGAAVRALTAWGCPLRQEAGVSRSKTASDGRESKPSGRPKLTLALTGRSRHAG